MIDPLPAAAEAGDAPPSAGDLPPRAADVVERLLLNGPPAARNALSNNAIMDLLIWLFGRGAVVAGPCISAANGIGASSLQGMPHTGPSFGGIRGAALSSAPGSLLVSAGYGGAPSDNGPFARAGGGIGLITGNGSARNSPLAARFDPDHGNMFGLLNGRIVPSSSLGGAILTDAVKGAPRGSQNPSADFGIPAHGNGPQGLARADALSLPWPFGSVRRAASIPG
jgi:hypothetical protein